MYLRTVKQLLRQPPPAVRRTRVRLWQPHRPPACGAEGRLLRVDRDRQGVVRIFRGNAWPTDGATPGAHRHEPEHPHDTGTAHPAHDAGDRADAGGDHDEDEVNGNVAIAPRADADRSHDDARGAAAAGSEDAQPDSAGADEPLVTPTRRRRRTGHAATAAPARTTRGRRPPKAK